MLSLELIYFQTTTNNNSRGKGWLVLTAEILQVQLQNPTQGINTRTSIMFTMEYEKSISNRKTIISYINDLSDKLAKNEVSKKLTTEHSKSNIQLSWKSKRKNCSKTLTYGCYKNRVNLEAYLSLITNRADRRIMTKLRLSDHCLIIERGRHYKPPIERDKRFCSSCKDKIEDETHLFSNVICLKKHEKPS